MSKYEFSQEQNKLIRSVAIRVVTQAVLLVLIGLTAVFQTVAIFKTAPLLNSMIWLVHSLVLITVGILFFRPSDNLKKIITTEGQDIPELITALGELSFAWKITSILVIAIVVLNIVISII